MSEKSKPFLNLEAPWSHNDNSIWLATTFHLSRNIEKFNFPGKLTTDKRQQIVAIASKEVMADSTLKSPSLYKSEDLTPFEKEFLYEHYLSPRSFHNAHAGEGFITDQSGQFLATINIIDHIHLHFIEKSDHLENVWQKLAQFESLLGKKINYSFTSKFGYLTSSPFECGTGLTITAFLHLPALIQTKKLPSVISEINDQSISITGLQGKPEELIGDIVGVHNNYTLGLTEDNIISSVKAFSNKLIAEETKLLKKIEAENDVSLKDRVSRAYGILIHSYQIGAVEAFNSISLLKLGVQLNWLEGVSIPSLNHLFFSCRRAHLLCKFEEEIHQEDVAHKRSEYIHNALKDAKLHI